MIDLDLPQGYEIHEIPADYTGPVWIEGQLRQYEEAVRSHYEGVMRQALEALDECAGITVKDAKQRVAAISALREALK